MSPLACQIADALAAAFPRSSMAQSQSPHADAPTQAKSSAVISFIPKDEPCGHPVPAALVPHLPLLYHCPTCTVEYFIKMTQLAQKRFKDHGGWSASKEKGGDGHKTARVTWRKAKVRMVNMVSKLEDLRADASVPSDVLESIQPALSLYESKKVQLGRVPGVQYVKGAKEDEPTEEHHEIAKLMIELLKMILDKEMEPADKAFVADKAFAMVRPGDNSVSPSSESAEQPATASSPPRKPKPTTSSPICRLTSGTLPSAFKRKHSPSSASITPNKRIRINDIVTVSPSHVIDAEPIDPARYFLSGPFQGDQGLSPTSQSHADHTTAVRVRTRAHFWRPGGGYTPGSWASQAFHEKINTSNWKTSWDVVDENLKKCDRKDRWVRRNLTSVQGFWIVVWWFKWWVKNVVPGMGLEKLKEDMDKSKGQV